MGAPHPPDLSVEYCRRRTVGYTEIIKDFGRGVRGNAVNGYWRGWASADMHKANLDLVQLGVGAIN